MQALFSLPVGPRPNGQPAPTWRTPRSGCCTGRLQHADRPGLQVLAPLLHGCRAVMTPSGMVAGAIAAAGGTHWSVAIIDGQSLPGTGAVAPDRRRGRRVTDRAGRRHLERDPAGIVLNDEVLAMPRTPSARAAGRSASRLAGPRAAAVRRTTGVRDGLANDGRVGLALNGFVGPLFPRGALRGRRLPTRCRSSWRLGPKRASPRDRLRARLRDRDDPDALRADDGTGHRPDGGRHQRCIRRLPLRGQTSTAPKCRRTLCGDLFSEATGIEATMTPRTTAKADATRRHSGSVRWRSARDAEAWDDQVERPLARLDLVAGRENFGVRLQGQIDVMDGASQTWSRPGSCSTCCRSNSRRRIFRQPPARSR